MNKKHIYTLVTLLFIIADFQSLLAQPCTSISTINCGTSSSISLSGSGVWLFSSCDFSPGQEKVYSFTPQVTGIYSLEVTFVSGGSNIINYLYKTTLTGCVSSGWTCIGGISSLGTYNTGTLTAGVEYYILLDAANTSPVTQAFQINCIATGPSNDNCANATTLTPGPYCSGVVSGTTVGATQSIPAISCSNTGSADDDVWYKFVATSTNHTLYVYGISEFDAVVDVRTGTCNGNNIACIDEVGSSDSEILALTGLTVGATYYIRVYSFGGSATDQGTFTICVSNTDGPCAGITPLSCGISETFTSTNQGVWNFNICGSSPGQEKIYSFTPIISGTYALQVNFGGGNMFFYYKPATSGGCSTAGWTCIAGAEGGGTAFFGPLAGGVEYYILADAGNAQLTTKTFQINCLAEPCSNIIPLSCDISATAVIVGSGAWNNNTCGFSSPGQEQIYSFTPQFSGEHFIEVTNAGGGSNYIDYMYKAASGGCNSANWVCVDRFSSPGGRLFGPLTAGVQYYILLDSETTSPVTQTFRVNCPASGITNDHCNTSALLTSTSSCIPIPGSTVGATPYPSLPYLCNTPEGPDVWYHFVATGTNQTVTVVGSPGFNAVFEVRSGVCGAPLIGCANATTSGAESLSLTGLTIGSPYSIRVYSPSSAGSFTICVTAPVDPCSGISTLSCGTPATVTLSGSGVWNNSTCLFSSLGKEKLYSFTPITTGPHFIEVNSVTGTGYIDYQYKAASGGCSATGWTCIGYVNAATTLEIGVLTAGVEYYILLDAEGIISSTQIFQISCPAYFLSNDNCSTATILTPNQTCTPINGTTVAATQSIPAITCPAITGSADDDVWYYFVATSTNHTVTVVGDSGFDPVVDVRSGACNGTNIGCSDATTSSGTETVVLTGLTIGSTYHIRIYSFGNNASDQGTFTICVTFPFNPCSNITTLFCGTPANADLIGPGNWNASSCGVSTPGKEKFYSFTPPVTGVYSLFVSASSGSFIDYMYKEASEGCISMGWTCIDEISFVGNYNIGTLTAGVEYYILLDAETTNPVSHTFQITCPVADPCSGITAITCGTSSTATLSGVGAWNNYSCLLSTPGQEKIYSFTPMSTGLFFLQVISASGISTIDYQYKIASGGCSDTDWTCIGDVNSATILEIGELTAGVEYYFLLDAEAFLPTTHTFRISCQPPVPSCLAAPVSPSNSATVCQNVTLSWPSDALATSYDVYFGTSPTPPFVTNVSGTIYNAGTLAGGTYYWQIRPKNVAGTASGCPIWSFTANDPVGKTISNPLIIGSFPYTHSGNNLPANCWINSYTGANNQASSDVFYRFTNTVCQNYVTISLCGSSFDTYVHLLNNSGIEIASNNNNGPKCPGTSSSIQTTLPAGTYYIVVEGAGSSSGNYNLSFSATDNILPMITCPSNIELCGSQAVTYTTPTATDNCSAIVTQTAGLASGAVFPVGTTTNTFQAADPAGNTVSCSFDVTIIAPVAMATPSSQTICSGAAITNIGITGTGTTYSWTRDNTVSAIGIAASGSGNINGSLNNLTNAPVTVTFTITPSIGACQGLPITASVLVNPQPIAFANPSIQTICSGDPISTISIIGNVSGTNYNWSRDNTVSVTGIAGSGNGNISGNLSNTTSAYVTVTFTIQPVGACMGSVIYASVTVKPAQYVDQPSNLVVCNGESTSVNFTGSAGTNLYWESIGEPIGLPGNGGGNIGPFTATNTTIEPLSKAIYVSPSSNTYMPGFAYTANLAANSVSVINTETNMIVATIGVGAAPEGIVLSPEGLKAYVTNSNSNNCYVINTSTNVVSAMFSTGGSNPKMPAISPDGSRLYIPNHGSNNVTVFNTVTNSLITTIPVGSLPSSAVFSPDGSRVFIINSGSGTISVINAYTNTVTTTLSGLYHTGVAVSPDGSRVYISSELPMLPYGSITVLDGNSLALITNIMLNINPTGLEVSPDGTMLYVSQFYPGSVSVINTSTNTEVTLINTLSFIRDVSLNTDGSRLYVAEAGYITVINTSTNTVTAFIPTGADPVSIDVASHSGANCSGLTKTFVITVLPSATVNPIANQTLCNGSNTTAINFNNPTIEGTIVYNWTNSHPSIGISASGSGNIASFTAINTTPNIVVATITVTTAYTYGSVTCNGTPIMFTIIVYPTPNANATPSAQTICSGGTITTIALSGNVTGTNYAWTRDNTGSVTGIPGSGSGNISGSLTNTTNAPVLVTFTVTPTANGCPGTAITLTVLVNPTPNAVAIPLAQTICSGGTITTIALSGNVTSTTYSWTRDNTVSVTGIAGSGSGNISGSLTNTTSSPVLATFTVTPTANSCPGSPITATVLVNPANTATITSAVGTDAQTVLINTPVADITYATTGATGATFSGLPAGVTGSWASNVVMISGTPSVGPATFNYTVTLTGGCGTITVSGTISVFVCSITRTSAVGTDNQVLCNNTAITNITYATTGATGATFNGLPTGVTGNWASNVVTISGTPSVSGTFNYTVTPTGGGCSGMITATGTITVNPIPTVNAVANQVICNSSSTAAVNFSGTPAGVVYNWTNNTPSISLGPNGIGNIAAFTATNATNSPVTATITVNPSYTNAGVTCTGTPITFTYTVNPTPTVNAVANQVLCNNASSAAITFTGFAPGTVYIWANNTPSIGLAASGSGNIASFTATNATNAPVTASITVTPTYTNAGVTCTGTPITFTVTVNPTPTVNAVANQVLCNTASTTAVTFTGFVPGTVYNWTNNTPSIGLASSGTGNIASFTATNATSAPVIATVTVTPTYTNAGVTCTGTPITFTYTVNPTPNAVATPSTQTICSAASISTIVLTGAVSGTAYAWTRDNNASVTGIAASGSGNISGALTNTTTAPVTVTFTITPTANSCPGPAITATVLVNPTPNAVATPPSQTICSAATITPIILSGAITGTTYAWTRDNNASVTGIAASGSGNISGTLTNTTTAPVTVTFTITPTANSCPGPAITATILVNPTPNAVATPPSQTICSAATISTIVLTGAVSGTTYAWTRDNTASVTGIVASGSGDIAGALTNTTAAPVLVTFTVTPTANSCPGPVITATVLVNPTPNAVATPASQTICSAASISTIVLTGAVSGTTYAWTRNNTATVTGIAASGSGNISGTLTNTTTAPITVTFTIIPTANGCGGPAITATVLVNPTPNAVATPPSQTICSAATITPIVLTGAVTGTTYAWTRNNTATVTGIAASGSGNISGTLTNTTSAPVTVTFTITPTANGCGGPAITATVLVNPTPNAIATPPSQGICTNNYITPIVLTGSVAGTAFNWTRNNTATVTGIGAFGSGNITGILVNNTAAPITVTFTITPTANGCTGNAITATVIVNPTPIGTISISPNPGCVGSTVQLSASGGTTYLWSGPQGFASTLQNPTILLTTYQQGGQYSVTITSGTGCSVVKYATLKVNYPPIATATYEQNTACTGSTLKLHGNGAGAYSWSGPAGFTSNLKDPVIVNVTSANSGLYTLTVTSPNGCTATTTINVTINTPQVVSANPTLTQTCEGSTVQLTASGTGSFSWSGPAGWLSINQNPVITNIPLYMSGTFTVTLTANTGCSSTASVTIKVYEQVKALATATPNPVCQGQSLQLHAEGGTKYLWTGPAGFQANETDPRIDNITMSHAGSYYVFISNEGGCSGYAEVKVEVKPTLKGTAGATPNPVQEFSPVQFTSSNGVSHSWTGPLGFTSTLQNPQIKKFTRAMAGIYTVTIINENGCPTIVKVSLKVNYTNKVTGTTDEEDNLETRSEKISKVYPNPTNDILYFECESTEAIQYTIFDLSGKEHTKLTTTTDNYISTSNLASGVYQIRWKPQDSEEWINSKFVKIR